MNLDTNINRLAKDIMARHDKNKDGVVTAQPFDAAPYWHNKATKEQFQKDELALNYDTGMNTYTYFVSMDRRDEFFSSADLQRDGEVTQDELLDTLKRFDKNGDGELNTDKGLLGFLPWVKSEFQRFQEQFSTVKRYTPDVFYTGS